MNPEKLHIALFMPSFRGGGAERVLVEFANWAVKKGVKVDLLVVSDEGPYKSEVSPGVNIINFNASRSLFSIPAYIKYLKANKPQGVVSTIAQLNIINSFLTRIFSPKTQVVLREATTPSQRKKKNKFKQWFSHSSAKSAYSKANKVIAVSEGVKTDMADYYGLTENVVVIPNPIVADHIRQKANEPLAKETEPLVQGDYIVAVGRLCHAKDFSTLIKSFKHFSEKNETSKLVILGEGELRKSLQEEINTIGLSDKVMMPGFLPNPFAVMARAKVLVMSSRYEGMPNVILQGMALNLPIVSTICNGVKDLLADSLLEKLVPVGDPKQLAEAIQNIFDAYSKPDFTERVNKQSPDIIFSKYLEVLTNRSI